MSRFLPLALLLALLTTGWASAQDGVLTKDDGPPISITSPDTGSTYAYGTLKQRSLYWSAHDKMLMARVVFSNEEDTDSTTPQDDTLEFRLPGVTFDQAKGIFSATTAKGEVIPIAHIRKQLFVKTIEMLPNARVRVIHERGVVNVILEAISPNDPAMHPGQSNPDGERPVGFKDMFN